MALSLTHCITLDWSPNPANPYLPQLLNGEVHFVFLSTDDGNSRHLDSRPQRGISDLLPGDSIPRLQIYYPGRME